jgi:hypothetical protein
MPRLKNRQQQVPNGLSFYLAETKWRPPRYASFDAIVMGLIGVLNANKEVARKLGWPIDYKFLANVVDEYNAAICQQMGWTDYISADGGQPAAVPFQAPAPSRSPASPTPAANLKRLAAGAETIVEWIASGAEAVPGSQANERAAVCVACPLNAQGQLTDFFTIKASDAIRKAYQQRSDWNLTTLHDEKLGVCSACSCPMRLKVHMGLALILKRLSPEAKGSLHPQCWILSESQK